MTPEFYAVIGSATAVMLALRKMYSDLAKQIGDLRERMATLEGEVRGFTTGFKATEAKPT